MKAETNCQVISKYKSLNEADLKNALRRKLADLINQKIKRTGQKE